MSNNYVILHCHTMLSNGVTNIDSVTKYTDYIQAAKKCDMKALAFSEHGCVFEWYHKKEALEKENMKFIHAQEFYITETLEEKVRDNYHCLLIALNYDGFLELNKLSTKAFNRDDNSYYYVPRISYDDLKNTSDNIIVSTACLGGILSKAPRDMKNDFVFWLRDHRDRCYLEIQPHLGNEQLEYNKKLYEISQHFQIPLLMCTDTHCLNTEHEKARKVLQKSKNIHFDGEDDFYLNFLSYEELVELCKTQNAMPIDAYIEAIENTNRIAERVVPFDIDYSYKYPHLWGDDSLNVFKRKIMDGIYHRGVDRYVNYQEYIDRIKYELEAYQHNQAIDFMLLMADIVDWCKSKDIGIGYGRGSANGSVIAWLLGITEMDSIKHNLNFDRFMNVERVSLSDIDTDFPPSRIDEVKDYIFSKHGLYCSDIVTFNTIATKGAIRDVGRALELDLKEVNYICDNVENNESLMRKEYPQLFDYVDIVNGTVVSVGSHPCFTSDALVFTNEGYKKIGNITTEDFVLTHKNNFKKVARVMSHKSNDLCKIKAPIIETITTPNHPFYVREKHIRNLTPTKHYINSTIKWYSQPTWKQAIEINKGDVIGFPVNTQSVIPQHEEYPTLDFSSNNLWWLIGRYLGDGWITDNTRGDCYLALCCNKNKKERGDIIKRLVLCDMTYRIVEDDTTYRFYIHGKELLLYLRNFGKYAYGKHIYNEVFNLPIEQMRHFVEGYISADGTYNQDNGVYSYKTISKSLALGFAQCVAKVFNAPVSITTIPEQDTEIKGKVYHCKEKYNCSFHLDRRRQDLHFYENGYIWYYCRGVDFIEGEADVYNLSVEDDNSYTVNNIAVHNCGTVVSPYAVDDKFGLFTTSTSNYPISQINMKEIDAQNYVKLDLLKLDTIELINQTCKLANIERITPDNIDVNDDNVWNSIRDDTTQIFQWEGKTGNDYIKKLLSDKTINELKKINQNIDKMTLLSIGNSAIRPAGASYRDDLGNGVIRTTGYDCLDDFLKPTFGFLVFQCQIIEFLHRYCGFTMGEADVVRRHFAKKYGTDKDIPIIKNGGYLTEDKKHYIKGFITTMQEQYGLNEEEANEAITSFLKVIIDASNYLFSLNHSQPYSYEGYVSGWLRYYYPLEFLTVALNINKDKEEKTDALTTYANKINITIKAPKFGYATNDYTCDKLTNTIYKGLGSIKGMQSIAADIMLQIAERKPQSFLDVLYLTNEIKIDNKKINTASMDILIDIGFFSEVCSINECKTTWHWFKELSKKKTIKKDDKTPTWLIDIAKKHCEKETEKQLSKIDSYGIIKEIIEKTPDVEENIYSLISNQIKYLGYADVSNVDIVPNIYVVQKFHKDKFGRYWLSVFQISSSTTNEYECDKKFASMHNVLEGDIIKMAFGSKPKYRKGENGKWLKTGEMKTYVKFWSMIK